MLKRILGLGALLAVMGATQASAQTYYATPSYYTAPPVVYAQPQPQVVYAQPQPTVIYAQPTYYAQPAYYPSYYGGYGYGGPALSLGFNFGGHGGHWH